MLKAEDPSSSTAGAAVEEPPDCGGAGVAGSQGVLFAMAKRVIKKICG